ncbi:FG-GAP repeat domain-containing protein [Streptomyces sp. NPDC059352]|uniref:FG-GAP repeat domain-containing protein n=1 Tax=Streptomyces sp. NPDC059352 TaxID=3346810 RepID=UPI0036846BE2
MRIALSRRRLSVSVGVVLAAVTAASLTAPATAAPAPAAPAVTAAQDATKPVAAPFLALGGRLKGAGATGFLSEGSDGRTRWTRYADGVSTVIEKSHSGWVLGSGSDTVVVVNQDTYDTAATSMTVYDMATGAPPVTISISDVPDAGRDIPGVAGGTILGQGFGGGDLTLTGSDGVDATARKVTGASVLKSWLSGRLTDAALVSYYDVATRVSRIGVVDFATASVVDSYATAGPYLPQNTYLSPKRVAWLEADWGKTVLVTAVRGQKETVRTPLGPDTESSVTGGLLGDDWFAFAATPYASSGEAVSTAFTARSLTDGSTVELLDHVRNITEGPDGTLLVIGDSAAHGEGVYRVAVGADGKPAAELVASTAEPDDATTPVTYVGGGAPALLDLDGLTRTRLTWQFSSARADFSVELTSKATGEVFRRALQPVSGSTGTGVLPDGRVRLDWAGEVAGLFGEPSPAPNGAYEWKVTAKPWNGMRAAIATGTFTVVRTPQPHDYGDNGSPDLLARSTIGVLRWIDTRWDDATGRFVEVKDPGGYTESGWGYYDRIESVGDVAGAAAADAVAREANGVLWLHQGRGTTTGRSFEPRVQVGGGWQIYDHITGGSDLTGDRRADLVATDKAGDLYLYAGTGKATVPFAPRKKIGYSWGIYNQLTATGDIGGSPAGDLVARDRAGVLWLYLGKGDGTFAARTRIGGGWNAYADIVAIGDGNEDGRLDLYARTSTNTAFLYAGTGDPKVPFKPRSSSEVGVSTDTGKEYGQVS